MFATVCTCITYSIMRCCCLRSTLTSPGCCVNGVRRPRHNRSTWIFNYHVYWLYTSAKASWSCIVFWSVDERCSAWRHDVSPWQLMTVFHCNCSCLRSSSRIKTFIINDVLASLFFDSQSFTWNLSYFLLGVTLFGLLIECSFISPWMYWIL